MIGLSNLYYTGKGNIIFPVGEEDNSSTLGGSSSWLKNQTDMRKLTGEKNKVRTGKPYTWVPETARDNKAWVSSQTKEEGVGV